MVNFKKEIFPEIEVVKKFDEKITEIEKNIAKNQTIQEILKENQKIIPKGAGVYFFYDTEQEKIVYVGISRKIKFRLQQHTNHKSSNSASLAYLMAKNELKNPQVKNIKDCFEKANNVENCRNKHQNKIKQFKVAFVEIENNFELALFEIYAAIKLKSYWNSFKTH